MNYTIEISPEIATICPDYRVILLEAEVENSSTPDELRLAIENWGAEIVEKMQIQDIVRRPGIAATRTVYKACGKDPNRYRPSHEQMMRRFFKQQGLYSVSALVDAGNLLSLKSGYSIGVFDSEKVSGNILKIGVGTAGEPYEGIGRGPLNIEGLPVVRDNIGGIGTPTSDNERTKTSPATSKIVVTIHVFGEEMGIDETIVLAEELFVRFCNARNIETKVFRTE